MDIAKILRMLDNILDGANTETIQSHLNELVEKYGHGVVEYVRYIPPGEGRTPNSTHFLTLASRSGAQVELELRVSRVVGFFLDMALERL